MKMGIFSLPHLIRLSNTSFFNYPASNTIAYNVSMISKKLKGSGSSFQLKKFRYVNATYFFGCHGKYISQRVKYFILLNYDWRDHRN